MEPLAAETKAEHPAEEFPRPGPWPVVAALGLGVVFSALAFGLWLLIPGLALFVTGLAGWLRQDLAHPSRPIYGRPDYAPAHVSIRKLGVWMFLGSEIMFFSTIIGSSYALRVKTGAAALAGLGAPWPLPGEILNVPLTGLNTFILIISSLTMVEALAAIERGEASRMRVFLLATMLLGITFLSIQGYEYVKLFGEGLSTTSAPDGAPAVYGATFYVQTGFHGAHVTGGVVALAYMNLRAWTGRLTKDDHEGVELVGLYWHFVDVVWIFLFTIVYLI